METMLYIFTKEVSLKLELIKKVLIDWVGKRLFQAKGDYVQIKKLFGTFFKRSLLYTTLIINHMYILQQAENTKDKSIYYDLKKSTGIDIHPDQCYGVFIKTFWQVLASE